MNSDMAGEGRKERERKEKEKKGKKGRGEMGREEKGRGRESCQYPQLRFQHS